MDTPSFATREEFWRLQETLTELSSTQTQHSERIMRLEKRRDDDTRVKNVWGPSSPFAGVLGTAQQGMLKHQTSAQTLVDPFTESSLNPTAEAFRNFDAEPVATMMSSLTLDTTDDSRRGVASRANSVRFDESANNHYGASSRQSIDIPTRTGSGLGMSERSLSHRSDGRGSASGFPHRTNSFGLESSRLLGSINNSPRVAGHPPPGLFILGPFPSIIRCWLTEVFSHSSLLYAAVCTGSYASSIGMPLVEQLGLSDRVVEESGRLKIKLSIYLTEAKVTQPSSRSASPAPQVPTLVASFDVVENGARDASIKIIIGSDVLRAHSADILLSQEKLIIFDEDRNQLSVPLVRPESEAVYRNLATSGSHRRGRGVDSETMTSPDSPALQSPHGIIGRPSRLTSQHIPTSPHTHSANSFTSAAPSDVGERKSEPASESTARPSTDIGLSRLNDDTKSVTESEKSFTTTPVAKLTPGVWANSWRSASNSGTTSADTVSTAKTPSTYSKPAAPRNMKVLRPSKTVSSASRTGSISTTATNGVENVPPRPSDSDRRASHGAAAENKPVPTKANPVGSASAFGWLNSGSSRRSTMNGE